VRKIDRIKSLCITEGRIQSLNSGDVRYWRNKYKAIWRISTTREKAVLAIIKYADFRDAELADHKPSINEYITGLPGDVGNEKEEPDITIPSVGVWVEVTGTDKKVQPDDDLWIRTGDLANANKHLERDTWIVHSLDREGLLRPVHLTENTINRLLKIPLKEVRIRGTRARYTSISSNDDIVKEFTDLLGYLKSKASH